MTAELPLTVYCPQCGAYLFLLGQEDFQCGLCGCVFDVQPTVAAVVDSPIESELPF